MKIDFFTKQLSLHERKISKAYISIKKSKIIFCGLATFIRMPLINTQVYKYRLYKEVCASGSNKILLI